MMRRPRPRSPPPPFAHAAARPRRPSCQPTIQPEPVPCTRALVCPPRMHSHRPARARARARHTRCGCPTHDEPFMHSVSVVAIAIPPRCTRAVLHPPQRAFMRERRARARGSEERELGWGVWRLNTSRRRPRRLHLSKRWPRRLHPVEVAAAVPACKTSCFFPYSLPNVATKRYIGEGRGFRVSENVRSV